MSNEHQFCKRLTRQETLKRAHHVEQNSRRRILRKRKSVLAIDTKPDSLETKKPKTVTNTELNNNNNNKPSTEEKTIAKRNKVSKKNKIDPETSIKNFTGTLNYLLVLVAKEQDAELMDSDPIPPIPSLFQERPRKPLREWQTIPRHDKTRTYTNFGGIDITGEQILKTIEGKWFSDDLVMASLQDLAGKDPDNVSFVNSRVFEKLSANGMMEYGIPLNRELVSRILMKNTQNALLTAGRKLNIFEKKLFFMPIYQESHWMLVILINPNNVLVERRSKNHNKKCIMYFLDPMGNMNKQRNRRVKILVLAFLQAHFSSYLKKMKGLIPNVGFEVSNFVLGQTKNIPLQTNSNDCGPFIIHYIETLLSPFTGILKQNNVLQIDWDSMAPRGSVETIRHRVRARILNTLVTDTDDQKSNEINHQKRIDLSDLVEFELRNPKTSSCYDLDQRSRRSRSQERNAKNGPKARRRCYSVDLTLFGNPAKICQHPATELLGKCSKGSRFGCSFEWIWNH